MQRSMPACAENDGHAAAGLTTASSPTATPRGAADHGKSTRSCDSIPADGSSCVRRFGISPAARSAMRSGRDVVEDILTEGTPDAARWLGLDRSSFLSIACIRQGDIRGIEDEADGLQDELQRAATSVQRDRTAAEAIERLEEFHREQVGQERAHSTKPLQRAKDRLARARTELERARHLHEEWLESEAQAVDLEQAAEQAARRMRHGRAQLMGQRADQMEARFRTAKALAARFSEGAPASPVNEALARQVTAALAGWDRRSEVPTSSPEDRRPNYGQRLTRCRGRRPAIRSCRRNLRL